MDWKETVYDSGNIEFNNKEYKDYYITFKSSGEDKGYWVSRKGKYSFRTGPYVSFDKALSVIKNEKISKIKFL